MTRLLLALFLFLAAFPATAQDDAAQSPAEERSLFLSFIENRLSTPNRRIRIRGIQGVLSSQASIAEITVADREGVWLRIENASIEWSRTALILRQRLEVARLAADSIEVIRRPLPSEGLPSPEARSFAIPELPIAINLEQLEVPHISFSSDVFGLESVISLEGRLRLEGGSLDTALEIERLDGPGGHLSLTAAYADDTGALDLDLALVEPQNGVVANLLNIEGRPPLSLTLAGSGPVENLDLSLSLAAAGQPALSGAARFRGRQEGIGFTVDVSGPIVRLIPARFRAFFGDETTLQATGVARRGGGLTLETLSLSSAALQIEASAETASDGFLTMLSLDASIADPQGERILLPVAGGESSVRSARLTASYGETDEDWQAVLDIDGLQSGGFSAGNTNLTIGGEATNLSQPAERRITFNLQGVLEDIVADRADIAEALGQTIQLSANGAWRAGEPLSLAAARLTGHSFTATLSGEISDLAFRGDIGLEAANLAPFSGLAGRELGGSLDLAANGEVRPISGAFDLTLDGRANELRIGIPAADALLGGLTRITGRLGRSTEGFTADNFHVVNDQIELTADGTFATEEADFRFDAAIADLAVINNRAEGRLTANGRATGSAGELDLSLRAQVPEGRLLDKQLTDAVIDFEGTLEDQALSGRVTGDAFLDGVRASLQTDVALADEERRLSGIDFTAGGARLTGDLARGNDGLFAGELNLHAADISTAAALLLTEATGAAEATLSLEPRDGEQHLALNATLRDVVTEQFSLQSADLEATVADLFGVPAVEGTVAAADLVVAGIDVARLNATAETSGGATTFSAEAALANGTDIAARGGLAPQDGGYTISLQEASLTQDDVSARLLRPASLTVRGDTVSFEPVEVDVAGGRVTAEGEIGRTLNVALSLDAVPLSIANTVRPDLALGGTLNGEATISGTREAHEASFTLTGRDIVAAALRQAGVASLSVDATGTTRNEILTVDAQVASPGGLRATLAGDVPLGEGALALDVELQAFPLSLLNARIPNQDLGGTLTGSARVTGSLADPRAEFNLHTGAFTARALAAFGAAPLDITASGRFAQGVVTLSDMTATGPAGLSVSASGRVPLTGSGLAVDVRGNVPLTLVDRLLTGRGAQFRGTAIVEIHIGGSLANPAIQGTVSIADATAFDPLTNLRLTSIRVDAGISGDTVTIRSASAAFAGGGTLSLSGTVSTSAAAGFPADLAIRLNEARYTDGELVTATMSGALTLRGPLTRDPLLSGNLTLSRVEITVPEHFGGGGPAQINVQHVDPPPAVRQTLRRARADDGTPMPSGRPSVLRLDVTVDAPARIFVRGRGLDAELGGSVQLTGPVTSVQPVGAFQLIRGRLSILTQRITFDEGTVSLVGDLDPYLDFVARSERRDITVFITVTGRVSDLSVDFSSQPELPEDEVLARLIFNRGLNELSPLQLAQLAAAAAELAGGTETSLLGSLRGATGLDELDIITDETGGVAVRAGRYIQENVYLGVEAGSGGSTRATINLDITEDLKARGAIGTGGESSLGIFYERDY
ncbi:translocation/assembly module TamB domain-containing protein [Chelativorans salis]|uniref:Translocation/assembly module TamB domain-containing protein n=1 Tax=Chelativorans salis TaxID=2978478 RepID=A0ABT2LL53_9HYPH|nr:translocation/assembly module TamB domain-containing protein [Chelativorans sp. EGI FJ00035]MCT7375152.1 translocation/assembly module TamB domain-containing protein [Chelativorans sp. EGI FJ00035]